MSFRDFPLRYSQDFGAITKESLKRKTKWRAKYFSHDKSYYPVSQTSMEFAKINFMQPLLSEEISPDTETAIKEFAEEYGPVRKRAVYSKEQDCNRVSEWS